MDQTFHDSLEENMCFKSESCSELEEVKNGFDQMHFIRDLT